MDMGLSEGHAELRTPILENQTVFVSPHWQCKTSLGNKILI